MTRCQTACHSRALLLLVASVLCVGTFHPLDAADEVSIAESATDSRTFSVRCRVQVEGTVQTSLQPARPPSATPQPGNPPPNQAGAGDLKLKVDGRLSFLERRIAPAGQDADALRSLREYQVAEADIDVAGRKTLSQLPESMRVLVAEGQRDGIRLWSPTTRMTRESLELLRSPGDSLALAALLPTGPVNSSSTWQPPFWVLPLLTGVDAVSKSTLDCRMEKLDSQFAIFQVSGSVEGAIDGALTKITVTGQVACDLKARHIRQAKVTQIEDRAVGAVSPGMKVTATVYIDRLPSTTANRLTTDLAQSIPVAVDPGLLMLSFETPWGLRFGLDRNWHVFHQTPDVAVLRMIDKGSLIAQCNVSPVATVKPGTHTPDEQFVNDIRTALGTQLQEVTAAEEMKAADGQRFYRVNARGTAREVGMDWLYYLGTAPSGQQAAFVFSVESRLREQLANRDRALIESVQFALPAATRPATPARTAAGTPQ